MRRTINSFIFMALVFFMILTVGACGSSDTIGGDSIGGNPSNPGNLDTAFGSSGKVWTNVSGYGDKAYAVAVQTDGKIVVVGYANDGAINKFAVVRYTSTGALDATFGTGGKVTTQIGSSSDAYACAVAIQTDGKIVVAGNYLQGSYYKIAVVRYKLDGSRDSGFGSDGIVTTSTGFYNDMAYGVAIQTDNKIVVAGSSSYDGTNNEFAIIRYSVNGIREKTVTTRVGSVESAAFAVAIQSSDQQIVLAGYARIGSTYDIAVVRYNNTNLEVDTLFNSTGTPAGIVTTPIGSGSDIAYAVVIQPATQKILVVGSTVVSGNNTFAMVRYNPAGTLDTGFGKVTTSFGSGNAVAQAVCLQTDGKILAAGFTDTNGTYDFALARYSAEGVLDTTFKSTGKVITPIGSAGDYAYGVAVQTDGKIVLAGYANNGTDDDFALARYWP